MSMPMSVNDASQYQPPAIPVVPRHWMFAAEPTAVRRARQAVAAAMAYGCRPKLVDDLTLLTSELVTNAVRYGPQLADEHMVEVTLWPADGVYWLAVSDAGTADLPAPRVPGLEACGGRGLLLVDALAAAWAVRPRADVGKTVVAGIRAGAC
jgi:anti-sigma regulatory factor (Ser/Thr protein kinase)